ncbi:MAG: PEP-CTERM sorting domain-containing protein [Phycisphaerae bacterium]|nr:PEP-CTERM sorting domain-containing protein [Phycisphaerae bacterium]
MKHWIGTFALVALAVSTARADFTFDDIEYWIGSGSNEAAFVVDWNDGVNPESLAWGYRWDGTATGEDMLMDIVTTDPGLYAKISEPGGYGVALYGMGYDVDRDGFAISDGTVFTDGLAITGSSDTATAVDPDDHYQEGWMSAGFWSYWLSDDGVTWEFSGTGMSGRTLTDGAWDGWSWAPEFDSSAPSEPVPAVPEPATAVLFGLGMLFAARRR